jgi:Ca2+-binding RTX toxin-like protein
VVVRLPGVDGPAFDLRGETVVRHNEAALKDAALYLFAPAAQDMAGGAENDQLVGSGGADLLEGLRGADLLTGAGRHDMLFGGAGSDTLDGGTGRDVLSGGEGRDSLSGGSGDDMLLGGAGADTLTGGNGADVFFFVQTDLAGATDRITDFELGTDRLAFDFDAASALSYQVGTNEVIVSLKDTGAQVVVLEIDRIDVALIEGGGLL